MSLKKTYAAPRLSVHGKLEDLTHGQTDGSKLDADYPTDTPKADLTFS